MKDKRNHHGTVGKWSLEQHFCKSTAITLSCEISGALHLVQPDLMAGKPRQGKARQTDKIQVIFEIFKIGCRPKCSFFALFNQGTVSLHPNQCILVGFFG